ncbi:MAG: 4-phosphoerythronate dehydrogenase [Bacteroidales bacterium]|nr:4-phosphoerythronate dehydrogenase [Bacteroidales bacterium]MBQ7458141.1 4-phosphoerythronate dehydrogenase [Bacteroidales bacterium]
MLHKIIIDAAVPYIKGVFEPYFKEVEYVPGAAIDAQMAGDADALVIRTRTKCNAALLEGSAVKVIATATIGLDHIDTEWCKAHGIAAFNAPGCNADGVMEYVFAALNVFGKKMPLEGATLGVIGVGQVGHRVADMGRKRGFKVLENDPPLQAAGTSRQLVDLDTLLRESDIVTIHIPLWAENRDFASTAFFEKMKPGAIFINASRGGIVDEAALLAHRDKLSALAIDVWKGEPIINPALLAAADIATPHIAGYTIVGKINGTVASVRNVARTLGIEELENFSIQHSYKPYNIEGYDILADDVALRADPSAFESLRNHYNLRG